MGVEEHDHDRLVAIYGECIRCLAEQPPEPAPRRTGEGGAACEFCGQPVETGGRETYRRVTGWVRDRKGGGTNAIRLRKEEHRYACQWCIDRLVKGQPIGDSLLDQRTAGG